MSNQNEFWGVVGQILGGAVLIAAGVKWVGKENYKITCGSKVLTGYGTYSEALEDAEKFGRYSRIQVVSNEVESHTSPTKMWRGAERYRVYGKRLEDDCRYISQKYMDYSDEASGYGTFEDACEKMRRMASSLRAFNHKGIETVIQYQGTDMVFCEDKDPYIRMSRV
jgi:hypothetical protein